MSLIITDSFFPSADVNFAENPFKKKRKVDIEIEGERLTAKVEVLKKREFPDKFRVRLFRSTETEQDGWTSSKSVEQFAGYLACNAVGHFKVIGEFEVIANC